MTDLKISNMLDQGLLRIKKRKSPKKKSASSEKYKQFLNTKRKRIPWQKNFAHQNTNQKRFPIKGIN